MNDNNLYVQYYAVGFLDILGQQDKLRKLKTLPDKSNQKQMESFIKDLKGTYGVVTGIRQMFDNFFESYSATTHDLRELSTDQKRIFNEFTTNPIQITSFSDSVIAFTSLRNDNVKLPVKGVWGIITAAASVALISLAAGHPIRGGIDVGLGMEIEKNEIYGPCLSRAYTLESKIAQYPRIVVGEECVKYLNNYANQKVTDIYSQVSSHTAKSCLDLLTIDDDGNAIVDYLGDLFQEVFNSSRDSDISKKAYENIITFSEKFRQNNDTKKAFRYRLLRSYFEERLNNPN